MENNDMIWGSTVQGATSWSRWFWLNYKKIMELRSYCHQQNWRVKERRLIRVIATLLVITSVECFEFDHLNSFKVLHALRAGLMMNITRLSANGKIIGTRNSISVQPFFRMYLI